MSFGFGVGDFVRIIELVDTIRARFVDAPEQFKAISDEVRSLSIILNDVKIVLSQKCLTTDQEDHLRTITKGCQNVLDDLNTKLGKYQELESKTPNQKSIRQSISRGWKKLRWEPDDIKELRSRITSNISLLDVFNAQLDRQVLLETKGAIEKLNKLQEDAGRRQEHEKILHWLTTVDYSHQQNDYISKRQEATGQWLLDSAEYQQWLSQSKQTMFCPGIPGAGKTIATSIVIQDLIVKFQNDPTVGIAFLYCNFRQHEEQTSSDLFLSLLRQLVQQQKAIPDAVNTLFQRHSVNRTRPTWNEISDTWQSVIAEYSRVFVAIDALDECRMSDGSRDRVLTELFKIQDSTGVNLFATSRFIPEIVNRFETCMSLEIRATDDDVRRYIEGHVYLLPSFVRNSLGLQKEIADQIIKAVSGMFLLAQLHLGSLIGKRSPKAVRTALIALPTGSGAYDKAYNEAMQRIEGQVADSEELAKQVLSWITCAKRPLTTSELQYALAVEIGKSEFDKDNFSEVEDVVSVCAGLVIVDEESDIIRLVHYTTQEYFDRTWRSWFPEASENITKTCVTCLLFKESEDQGMSNYSSDTSDIYKLPWRSFFEYAAEYWGDHARGTLIEADPLIIEFLENGRKVERSITVRSIRMKLESEVPYRDEDTHTRGIHLAAYFGLEEALAVLIEQSEVDINSKDIYQRTPLHWAVEHQREAMVKLLLGMGRVEVDSQDYFTATPLLRAAEHGNETIVKLLLETGKADVNSRDEYGRTPIYYAVSNGYKAVVKLLLDTGKVDLELCDDWYGTPLDLAIDIENESAVKMLVDTGKAVVNKELVDLARDRRDKAIVELLEQKLLEQGLKILD